MIRINPKHKGFLHAALGVPQGEPIPMAKKQAAANSSDPRLAKQGQFAVNAAGFKHGGKKKSQPKY